VFFPVIQEVGHASFPQHEQISPQLAAAFRLASRGAWPWRKTPLASSFSPTETVLTARFADAMRFGWAALDTLRNRASGGSYVADVNKTDLEPGVGRTRDAAR